MLRLYHAKSIVLSRSSGLIPSSCTQPARYVCCYVYVSLLVVHCFFGPFAVRHTGTFSALNLAGFEAPQALKVSARCAQVRFSRHGF